MFNGTFTGLGLADFLLGRPSAFNQAQLFTPTGHMNYVGSYVQDAWTATPNLTLNIGLRWDPFFPYANDLGRFNHFSLERFRSGVRSTRFRNAPVGVIFRRRSRPRERIVSAELRTASGRGVGPAAAMDG